MPVSKSNVEGTMIGFVLKTWAVLLLLPAAPVILLYAFFARQNYFELTDQARGIVAVGPIAAYVGLVLVGWRIYLRISATLSPPHPALRHLLGDWTLKSISARGNIGEGKCQISSVQGRLSLSGDFVENGVYIGSWSSEIAQLKDNRLHMVYTLRELKKGEMRTIDCLCTLSFGSPPISQMTGIWIVAGQKDRVGNVTYTKTTEQRQPV
jgi:hypothetical protein